MTFIIKKYDIEKGECPQVGDIVINTINTSFWPEEEQERNINQYPKGIIIDVKDDFYIDPTEFMYGIKQQNAIVKRTVSFGYIEVFWIKDKTKQRFFTNRTTFGFIKKICSLNQNKYIPKTHLKTF